MKNYFICFKYCLQLELALTISGGAECSGLLAISISLQVHQCTNWKRNLKNKFQIKNNTCDVCLREMMRFTEYWLIAEWDECSYAGRELFQVTSHTKNWNFEPIGNSQWNRKFTVHIWIVIFGSTILNSLNLKLFLIMAYWFY